MESKQEFGRYLREKRQAHGLSQKALAGLLYVSESAVSKWERGVSYPDITQITPICEALGISEHELVTASDDWRQRKIEREAATARKVRRAWLWGVGAVYALAILSGLFQQLGTGLSAGGLGSLLLTVLVCLACSSLTHVPLLVGEPRDLKALASLTVTMLASVLVGCLFANSAAAYTRLSLVMTAWLLLVPWASVLLYRHAGLSRARATAALCAFLAAWVYAGGGVGNLTQGLPFDWHLAPDWSSIAASNDNLIWMLVVLLLGAAAVALLRDRRRG